MSAKALRVDPKAQRRIGVARDQMLGMTEHQLSTLTSERLQSSYGLLPLEADHLLAASCRS